MILKLQYPICPTCEQPAIPQPEYSWVPGCQCGDGFIWAIELETPEPVERLKQNEEV